MQKHFTQILVLLLSVVMHLGAGYFLGSGVHAGKSSVPSRPESGNLVATLLSTSNDGAKVDESERTRGQQKLVRITPTHEMTSRQMDEQDSSEQMPILSVVMPPTPYYFLPDELTEGAHVALDVSPDLAFSMPNGLSQLAVLRLMINEYGDIDEVVMENSDLPEQTQQLVIDAFEKIKFQPGKVEGIAVKSQLKIEVTLEGFDVDGIRLIDLLPAADGSALH